MVPGSFDYAAPDSLGEAIALLRKNNKAKILAGGQSLLNNMKLRHVMPSTLVDLQNIQALHTIEFREDKRLRLGAMATFTQIIGDKVCQEYYPILVEALRSTPGIAIRNRSTLGGSLAQREIGADILAVVLVLGATINVFGRQGLQSFSADEFCTSQVPLANDEIITSIDLPAKVVGSISAYTKFKNRATGNAICGIAANVVLTTDDTVQECRIAATGIAERTVRLSSIEQMLTGKRLNKEVIATIEWTGSTHELITDLVASAEYRAYMTTVLVRRAMSQIAAQINS